MLIFILLDKVFNTTFFDFIYEVLQSPLQGVTDSLGGALLLGFVIPLFWFFGVHGSTIVGGIMGPILQANSLENTEILKSGKDLTLANGVSYCYTTIFRSIFNGHWCGHDNRVSRVHGFLCQISSV